jgi:hypothetical protein
MRPVERLGARQGGAKTARQRDGQRGLAFSSRFLNSHGGGKLGARASSEIAGFQHGIVL